MSQEMKRVFVAENLTTRAARRHAVVMAVLALALLLGLRQSVFAQTITEFPLAAAGSNPAFITAGPDGNLWFTEFSFNPRIGRITAAGSVTEFPTAGAVAPFGIAVGADGNLWFTEAFDPDYHHFSPAIGRMTRSGEVTRFPLPESSNPLDIAAGPDGNLWFTEKIGDPASRNRIGRITPAGVVTEFAVPTPGDPVSITAGPDGNLWFAESRANRIGRITTSGDITEFSVPTSSSAPGGITAGPDGNLWFTEAEGNKIGRITTAGTVTEFPIPTARSGPGDITAGPDGNLWFIERAANQIGRITPAGLITEFSIPTSGSLLTGITAGPDGNVWFTQLDGNKIGRINLVPSATADLRILPVVGSTPGAGGSYFRTSVQLHNPTSSLISGRIVFHRSGVAGSESDPAMAYLLAPGQTESIADLLPAQGISGLGSADIVSVGTAPTVTARVFDDASAGGTTGFTAEAMRPEEALHAGQAGVLLVPVDLSAYRMNIGVRTLTASLMTLTVRDASGVIAGVVTRAFPAVYHEQQTAVLFLNGMSLQGGGSVSVAVSAGTAIVYGTTVDNRTGDPSFQIARAAP